MHEPSHLHLRKMFHNIFPVCPSTFTSPSILSFSISFFETFTPSRSKSFNQRTKIQTSFKPPWSFFRFDDGYKTVPTTTIPSTYKHSTHTPNKRKQEIENPCTTPFIFFIKSNGNKTAHKLKIVILNFISRNETTHNNSLALKLVTPKSPSPPSHALRKVPEPSTPKLRR
ncbi:hypothetical protein D0Y65_014271 [Glycine soja]|uniref:Uncharacterized protein n=1 Tax=Glycine soja TaxID=3848 RepID=A0A445K7G7_GLYSO|nr:hypothetical protein D0Y65_014271 [Glycine soja]